MGREGNLYLVIQMQSWFLKLLTETTYQCWNILVVGYELGGSGGGSVGLVFHFSQRLSSTYHVQDIERDIWTLLDMIILKVNNFTITLLALPSIDFQHSNYNRNPEQHIAHNPQIWLSHCFHSALLPPRPYPFAYTNVHICNNTIDELLYSRYSLNFILSFFSPFFYDV